MRHREFGRVLRRARVAHGLSLRELCARLPVLDHSAVYQWEVGNALPLRPVLDALVAQFPARETQLRSAWDSDRLRMLLRRNRIRAA